MRGKARIAAVALASAAAIGATVVATATGQEGARKPQTFTVGLQQDLDSANPRRLGIEARCRGEDLGLAPVPDAAPGSAHVAACHAVGAPARVAAAEARERAA